MLAGFAPSRYPDIYAKAIQVSLITCMRLRKFLAVTVALLGTSFALATSAHAFTNVTQLNNSVLLAHYLGATTCGQPTYTIPIHVVPDSALPGLNAEAHWLDPGRGPEGFVGCYINIRAVMSNNSYEYGCRVMIHEFGHLHSGSAHSPDPANIMYGGNLGYFWPCAWLTQVAPA